MIKVGTRLQSQVCETQVIVIASSDSLDDLCAGGVVMIPFDGEKSADAQLDPELAQGAVIGKRYVHDSGAEVLVTRSGAGTLSVGGTPLEQKAAKPLPASD